MVRFKHRYFTVEVIPGHKPNSHSFKLKSQDLHQCLLNTVQKLHGDYGIAAVLGGFKAKYCNPVTRLGVIRVRHGPHRLVASCLPIVKSIKDTPVSIRTLYTGASLKHCFKFAVKHQKQALMKMWNSLANEGMRQMVKNSIMDLSVFRELETNIEIPAEFRGEQEPVI
ncbi:ribonuclease P/MRP protein subunit POP5 [Macrosteles quadrilineatus]|uniref:ribonuclease P/MRP protein subunit POP5 n=1 Tax=Macrosteles quadrilineatus TaxID=74068 RepID=UPI0023E349C3|nr:ribonuclease P/MRP protein subunit POP5 [Macrosteles quadrilineatus]